jgi:hypothetical protein
MLGAALGFAQGKQSSDPSGAWVYTIVFFVIFGLIGGFVGAFVSYQKRKRLSQQLKTDEQPLP